MALFPLLLTSLLAPAATAGPWVKDAGEAYVKTGYSRFGSRDFVQPDGAVLEDARYLGQTANLYGEVGTGRDVQLMFDLPYVDSRNLVGETSFVNSRLGDLRVGVELGNLSQSTPLSFQLSAKVPLYDNDRFSDRKRADNYPALGDGQVDLTGMFALGTGLEVGPARGWLAAELGYRHRTEWWVGDSSRPDRVHVDGVPYGVQLGWTPYLKEKPAGWVQVSADGIKNFRADESTREFLQVGVGGAVRVLGGLAVEAGYGELLWANNSARGGGLRVGLSWSGALLERPATAVAE